MLTHTNWKENHSFAVKRGAQKGFSFTGGTYQTMVAAIFRISIKICIVRAAEVGVTPRR